VNEIREEAQANHLLGIIKEAQPEVDAYNQRSVLRLMLENASFPKNESYFVAVDWSTKSRAMIN